MSKNHDDLIAEAKIYAINWRCNESDERTDVEMIADFALAHEKATWDRMAEYEAMLDGEVTIDGKDWSISYNGNPNRLIALRQFDADGNTLSYTHHDSALDAYKALKEQQ